MNMKNFGKSLAVAKVNFRCTTWIAYMVSGICVVAMLVDAILDSILATVGNKGISMYSMLYLICLLAPVFLASVNYRKFMNIGVKKKTYFYGCIINYVVFAAAVSLLSVIASYTLDVMLRDNGNVIYSLIEVFGWDSNVFTAFFSQFAFLLLVESFIHTLTFMQTRWYGWVADVLIVTIISVLTPIPVLRSAEVFFFDLIIFSYPAVQISICLALSALIYATNLFYLKKRN